MTVRTLRHGALGLALLLLAAPATAAPLAPAAAAETSSTQRVDYRPYYHCHGPKRCHGKGSYYKYTPSEAPLVHACRYGRGCGYNTGWNSPSSRFDYIGSRYGRHRHHRRHRR